MVVAVVAAVFSVASVSWMTFEPFEDLLEQGSQAAEDGRYEDSLARLSASFDAMPQAVQVGDVGRFVVEEALRSFERGPQGEADVATALALLDRYFRALRSARAAGKTTVAANDVEASLLSRREELAARVEGEPPEPIAASPEPERAQVAREQDIGDLRHHKGNIALLTVGSLLVAGGVPMLVQGLRYPSLIDAKKREARAEQERQIAEDPTLMIDESAWAAHEAAQRRVGFALTGVGAGVMAVGAALVLWGGVRWGKRRASTISTSSPGSFLVRF